MKQYVIISGLNLNDNNRGTAALSYGAISFLFQKGLLNKQQKILNYRFVKKFWKHEYKKDTIQVVNIDGISWEIVHKNIFILEKISLLRFGLLLPFTSFGKSLRCVERIAAINGGDGFSDIYGTKTFLDRLTDIYIGLKMNIPIIQLPQTLGPFINKDNLNIAKRILINSEKIFIRDNKFVSELNSFGVKYELSRDLSFYMKPQVWNISVPKDAIGINVSGLAYSNKFRTLSGQFDYYPELINQIVNFFQSKSHTIFLIPHSYNYQNPEKNNDDIIACRNVYNKLRNKSNIIIIDKDLTSPQIKYVISKMKFFIGTRMHANFAAIYTGIPLFGLAYSYKFEGAFNANGLDGKQQTAFINNITKEDIPLIIKKIDSVYLKFCK